MWCWQLDLFPSEGHCLLDCPKYTRNAVHEEDKIYNYCIVSFVSNCMHLLTVRVCNVALYLSVGHGQEICSDTHG